MEVTSSKSTYTFCLTAKGLLNPISTSWKIGFCYPTRLLPRRRLRGHYDRIVNTSRLCATNPEALALFMP